MARTIQEIYDSIIQEKENSAALNALLPNPDNSQTFLNDLTSSSKVAIWRLWAFVISVAINIHEIIFDQFKKEIEAKALEIPTGTPIWYHEQSLLFQYGDSLTWNGSQYIYDPINTNNQIVKLASVNNQGTQVRIKAAKLSGGLPVPLTAAELTAFEGYWNKKKFAGTATLITSSSGDDLKLDYYIQYDPLILAPDGSLLLSPSEFPVINAINNHIQNLPFDGSLSLMELTDSIQLAEGVLDVTLNEASAKFGALSYSLINKEYLPDSGYLILDNANSIFTYSKTNI